MSLMPVLPLVAAVFVGAALGAVVALIVVRRRQRLVEPDPTNAPSPRAVAAVADALADQSADVVLIVDDQDRIRYASPSARAVFGTGALQGILLPDLIDPAERGAALFLLEHTRAATGNGRLPAGRADWTVYARDGGRAQVEVSCRRLAGWDANQSPPGAAEPAGSVLVTLRDVTTQRDLERELTRRVFHDPLTGMANRQLFRERLDEARAGDRGEIGVLLASINDLKTINSSLGHEVGDAVVIAVSHRLRQVVGYDVVTARLSDDEFAAMIASNVDGHRPVTKLLDIAERVVGALSEPVPLDAGAVSCSVNVGVATSTSGTTTLELLRQASLALDAARATGQATWHQYRPSIADRAVDRAVVRSGLSKALHDGSLSLDYQPIVALDTGEVAGLEALVRWQPPEREQLRLGSRRLAASAFIDVAEESGLVVPIGQWVMAAAMAAGKQWESESDTAMFVSINVSPQQFRAGGFLEMVHRLLGTTGLNPDRLVLEITESSLLGDDEPGWNDLVQLRQSGIRVAIDDFGTGYSALSYLRQAPIDIVKLDRVFTASFTASQRQRELVEGIVSLARSLRLDVVAEGIETEAEHQIAAAVGCRYGQGYLFGWPDPVPRFAVTAAPGRASR